jgi:hypothetical protein
LLLLGLAGETERMSVFDATSTHAARGLLESYSRNPALVKKEAERSESLSDLEEDLDRLLKLGDEGATANREAPIFDNHSDSDDNPKSFSDSHLGLTITMLQGL